MIDEKELKRKGRYMSLLLRHQPEKEKLRLDERGYCSVDELCSKLDLTKEDLDWIVANNSKKRFSYNEDCTKIRANQGHSIKIKLDLVEITPPPILYHGTAKKYLSSIQKEGLKPMSRHHVHLSKDLETARQVGRRHGMLRIIKIDAKRMHADGIQFYESENGVVLVDHVDVKYFKNQKS